MFCGALKVLIKRFTSAVHFSSGEFKTVLNTAAGNTIVPDV